MLELIADGYAGAMSDRTYAITHVVGTSTDSVAQAIRNGIKTVSSTVRHVEWFEVDNIRGFVGDTGDVQHFQVTMQVGFRYEDEG